MVNATNATPFIGPDPYGNFVITTSQNESQTPPFKIIPNGIKVLPLQPYFNAYRNAFLVSPPPLINLIPELVAANVGGHYNSSNGVFTAPTQGRYLFKAAVRMTTVPASTSSVVLKLLIGNTAYNEFFAVNPAKNSIRALEIIQAAIMQAGETARVIIETSYPVNILGLDGFGGTAIPRTYFEGRLLG